MRVTFGMIRIEFQTLSNFTEKTMAYYITKTASCPLHSTSLRSDTG